METAQHTKSQSQFQDVPGLEVRPGCVIPLGELEFRFSRSGGPGGQNVNKVESRVELMFRPGTSQAFTEAEQGRVVRAIGGRLEGDGVLRVTAEESRSQWVNRGRAMEKLVEILAAALRPVKKRKPTRLSAGARLRRKESKRRQSAKKRFRASPGRETE